jgi:hypothetical protein
MSQAAFPAGTIIAEGTLYADPKKINRDGKNATVSLKTKLNYREQEGDELDAFFIDIIVTGSTAENILESGWKKYDRISFVGDFKGHRWERKLDDGINEEQTITVFARQIGASPRFTGVSVEAQEYNGNGGGDDDSRSSGGSSSSRRSTRGGDDEEAPRSSRRSSRGGDDDAPAEESRSSRRSSRGNSDDTADEQPSARRSSRRARDTTYGDDD